MQISKPIIQYLLIFIICLGIGGCDQSEWKSIETQHLDIHYKPSSVADQQLAKVRTVYERTYLAAAAMAPSSSKNQKIDLYLYDDLLERAYADPNRNQIHIMYGPQYRLTSLHEFLVILMIPHNRDVPTGFSEGLYQSQSKLRYAMQRRIEDIQKPPHKRWPQEIADLSFMNAKQQDSESQILRGAFIRYLLTELEEEGFWKLYLRLNEENWMQVVEHDLQKNKSQIANDFRNYIVSRTEYVPGVK